MKDDKLQPVIDAVLNSKKYKNLALDLIQYTAVKELAKRRNVKETIKAVKNKLHQSAGVYLLKINYPQWLDKLRTCGDNQDAFMSACLEIMQHHASTRERLPVLSAFYTQLFALMPGTGTVLDIGCGFNPLALFWMPGARNIRYYAFDIYTDMITFLGQFFTLTGFNGQAEAHALLDSCPSEQADAAFLLKILPVLEQEKSGRGLELLEQLQVKYLVVSFPAKSLGGREKGMVQNYSTLFTNMIKDKHWQYTKIEFPLEVVFVVCKG